ncbi:Co-chaperone [Coemansia aciculifera]|uniref:Co-chaperone n=1 Tax=Coemansia aciculifera TaxID=417176 RepID=A0ACC1M5A0_9FUNG|nr:Co-chaperone [Coemansia aciculifera]KAJ2911116.1 Co-chaperone [Coemansia aciculifera]
MADWRNVGNWHWKERNCLEWAKKYFDDKLQGTTATSDEFAAEVTSVDSVSGDVDLNIRKGRLIAIYDVEIKLAWKVVKSGASEEALTGTITIPEVAHDTDAYVYDISAAKSTKELLPLKDFVRQKLTPEITKRLEAFTEDLKQANGSDMYIPGGDTEVPAGASAALPKPAAAAPATTTASAAGAVDSGVVKTASATFSTVSISQSAEFVCSADDLFATLTDPQRVAIWTRAPVDGKAEEGAPFKFFSGHIEGSYTKLVPGKTIEQTWRVATWPAGHYSTVKMELEQLSSSTRLSLKQKGVPFNEEDATKANWDRYYWNSIKGTFG